MIHPIQSGFMGYLHSQRITDANVVRTGSELCTMFATVLASEAASSRLLDLLGRVKQRRAAFNCAHAGGAYHARDPTHCLQHAPMLLAGTKGNFYHYGHILQLAKLAVREWFDIYHKDLSKEQWKRLMDRDFKGNPAKQWSTAITYAACSMRHPIHQHSPNSLQLLPPACSQLGAQAQPQLPARHRRAGRRLSGRGRGRLRSQLRAAQGVDRADR